MYAHKTIIGFILCLSFLAVLAGCGGSAHGGDAAAPIFLRSNIHAQQQKEELKASYANWTDPGAGHVMIPVNTPVTIRTARRGLVIVTQDTNKTIYFEFDEARMGMSNEQYINLITLPQPVDLVQVKRLLGYFDAAGCLETWPSKTSLQENCLWVVWSRLPNLRPMSGSERVVSCLASHIADCRGRAMARLRRSEIRSACFMAVSIWERTAGENTDVSSAQPPVSTSVKCFPLWITACSLRSRVVPGVWCTSARFCPIIRLKIVDFPTLGRPSIATVNVFKSVAQPF